KQGPSDLRLERTISRSTLKDISFTKQRSSSLVTQLKIDNRASRRNFSSGKRDYISGLAPREGARR
ncbi:unnamed protein product, partial [Amoebophrya sp. A25]